MHPFYRVLAALTVLLAGLVLLLQRVAGWEGVHPHALGFVLFFAVFTAFTFRFVKAGYDRNPDNFTTYFMASVVLRFFVSVGVFVVYLILYKDASLRFAFNFMVLYFVFTGFEIYHIVRNLRPFSKNP